MKKTTFLMLAIASVAVSLTGCQKEKKVNENKLIGHWQAVDGSITTKWSQYGAELTSTYPHQEGHSELDYERLYFKDEEIFATGDHGQFERYYVHGDTLDLDADWGDFIIKQLTDTSLYLTVDNGNLDGVGYDYWHAKGFIDYRKVD